MTRPGTLELIAAAFGIVSVFLSTRQIVWSWPTSLVNVLLYAWYFLGQRLYALMVLQGFFAAIALYGWYEWLHGGAGRSELRVSRMPVPLRLAAAGFVTVGSLALAGVLARWTDDPNPLIDGFLSVVSLTAQWMMARKYLENWRIWILVNCVSVPFFVIRAEYPTAVQYLVFLGLAISGHGQWRASLAEKEAAVRNSDPANIGP